MTAARGGRPHVAFAITALHDASGGAERVLVDVANGLHRRGYRVTVLTYQERNGPSFYPLEYGISHLDGRHRHARRRKGRPLTGLASVAQRRRSVAIATWLAQHSARIYRFRQLLRIARPDVAVGFLPSSYPYLTLAAWGKRIKTVASLHNVPHRDLGGDPLRWDPNPVDIAVRRRTLRRVNAVTVLLPSFVDQLEAHIRSKTYVIPNMIHPYDGPLADVGDAPHDNTILAVGRLSPAKDHATLLRAWATMEDELPDWRLRIIGSGPLQPDLESLMADLELQRATIDPPTDRINDAYTSAKFLVMSSLYEGFGLVTAEALVCGLPVIGFADCEGTNEIIVDELNGLLVEPTDDRVASLAAGMRRLVGDSDLRRRLAEAGPATTREYEPDVVIDKWEQLIENVVSGKAAT